MIECNSIYRRFGLFVLFGFCRSSLSLAPSVYRYRLELAGDVPDEGSGVEGYVRVVADLV